MYFICLFSFFFFLFSCNPGDRENVSIEEVILEGKHDYFSLDTENYPENNPALPIGIFDSGTGGLTVLDAIIRSDDHDNADRQHVAGGDGIADFQSEYFVYLGDQANMPYGNYSRENNVALLREHIIKDVHFLLGRKYYSDSDARHYRTDKEPVKAMVIACNTATAFGKADIERFLRTADLDLKVIGVIGAGVRGALDVLDPSEGGSIGVMATAGTVSSLGYVNTIKKTASERGYSGEIEVYQQAGIGLAGAIDGSGDYIDPEAKSPRAIYKGPAPDFTDARIDNSILERYGFDWTENNMLYSGDRTNPRDLQINSIENYISYHLVSLLESVRRANQAKKLKAIILGCTHYPFYTDIFSEKLNRLYNYQENDVYVYRSFMAENIDLIDPAINTAQELHEYLQERHLFNDAGLDESAFYISVPNSQNDDVELDSTGQFTYDYKYGREARHIQEYVKRVPFSREVVPQSSLSRLKQKIPVTFSYIQDFMKQGN